MVGARAACTRSIVSDVLARRCAALGRLQAQVESQARQLQQLRQSVQAADARAPAPHPERGRLRQRMWPCCGRTRRTWFPNWHGYGAAARTGKAGKVLAWHGTTAPGAAPVSADRDEKTFANPQWQGTQSSTAATGLALAVPCFRSHGKREKNGRPTPSDFHHGLQRVRWPAATLHTGPNRHTTANARNRYFTLFLRLHSSSVSVSVHGLTAKK